MWISEDIFYVARLIQFLHSLHKLVDDIVLCYKYLFSLEK